MAPMPIEDIISAVLYAVVGLMGWWVKSQSEELKRVQILVNKTREDMAREYVTKAEVHADINRVIDRLEALDAKLDRLMERK